MTIFSRRSLTPPAPPPPPPRVALPCIGGCGALVHLTLPDVPSRYRGMMRALIALVESETGRRIESTSPLAILADSPGELAELLEVRCHACERALATPAEAPAPLALVSGA